MRKHALALCLLLITSSAFAQSNLTRHYLGGWLFTGYSAMFHDIDNTSVIGGGGVGIGGGYQLRKGAFLFKTGVEFEFINSATNVTGLDGQVLILDTEGDEGMFHYQFHKFRDKQNYGIVNLPILFGAQFPAFGTNLYFLAGGKVGAAVLGTYGSSGSMKTWGVYHRFIGENNDGVFINMPNHYFHEKHKFRGNSGSSDLGFSGILNAMASLEVGIELNPYIFTKAKQETEKQVDRAAARGARGARPQPEFKREEPRVRVALFADYGLMNINNNPLKGGDILIRPSVGQEHQWFAPNGVIKKNLPTENLLATTNAFQNGKPKSVNPFIIGIKGTILFDVTKPPVIIPPKPPKPPPPPPPPPIFYITGKIINVETGAVVTTASVDMFNDKDAKVFSAKPQTGVFNTRLDRKGTYKVNVTAPSFYDFTGTFSNVGDTMMIYIQPYRAGDYFILKNIYFAHDRTELIETSNIALDSTAMFMNANPGMKFKVVGHTDGDGTDAYNINLSNGRARAVMNALISRGIDPARLTYEGRGKREPICPANDTPECKAQNRRVEIEITGVD
ncbi:MAG: OmpA family protein [Bacteroidetes bacterium]|nr:OmpA family protein [Bacteroidota bacterium]